jgi:hypothetical protein
MSWRALQLGAALGLACQLPAQTKDGCETDAHCLSGRVCLAGVCQTRVAAPPPVFTRLVTAFIDLGLSTEHPGGLESPRDNRFEIFVIEPEMGTLVNRGWGDDALDPMWYGGFLGLMPLKDGLDATSWGDLRQDIIVRDKDDNVVHTYFQPQNTRWGWQPVGARPGRFRVAITHLGRNRMVAFQVDAATGELWLSRFADDRWGDWTAGTPGKLGGGLDAATLHDGDAVVGAQLVSRDEAGQLVTATFNPVSGAVTPWTVVEGPPPGSEGQATVVSHRSRDYHLFVSARAGGVWSWSSRAAAQGQGRFVQLGNGDGQGGDLDAVGWPFDGRWRLALVRRDAATGRVEMGQLESDPPAPGSPRQSAGAGWIETSTQMPARR